MDKDKSLIHLAILRFSSMGDVAMMLPVLKIALEQNPNIRITVISRPDFLVFFETLDRCEFVPVDLDIEFKGIIGLYKLSKKIFGLKPDFILDLHDVLRTKVIKGYNSFMARIPFISIDKGRSEKENLCSKNVNKHIYPLKSTHERYADVFRKVGLSLDLSLSDGFIFPHSTELSNQLLSHTATQTKIGIAPLSRYQGKNYPEDLMKKVIENLLIEKDNLIIYLLGSKNDKEYLQRLQDGRKESVIVFPEQMQLEDELALISNLNMVLSMDSANMHIASMLGVPVVSIWGVTHPFLGFYGWKQNPDNTILADRYIFPLIPSSVNGCKVFPEIKDCMNSIRPEIVVSKIIENI